MDLLQADAAFEPSAKPHAQLGLETGIDQFGGAEHMAGRPGFEDASKYRLVKSKLLLDRLCGQSNLPTDLALARGDPPVDQRKLNSIRIIQRQPVKIGLREELAP